MTESQRSWTVLLVDDSPEFLDATTAWMSTRPELRVVGTAANGEEALGRVEELRPDLILMDAMMPILDGFEATRRLREAGDARWVVIASLHDSEVVRREAWAAGADGFVSKAELIGALPGILRDLAAGKTDPQDGGRGRGAAADRKSAKGDHRPRPDATPGTVERRAQAPRSLLASLWRVLISTISYEAAGLVPAFVMPEDFDGPRRGRSGI